MLSKADISSGAADFSTDLRIFQWKRSMFLKNVPNSIFWKFYWEIWQNLLSHNMWVLVSKRGWGSHYSIVSFYLLNCVSLAQQNAFGLLCTRNILWASFVMHLTYSFTFLGKISRAAILWCFSYYFFFWTFDIWCIIKDNNNFMTLQCRFVISFQTFKFR